MFWNTTFRWTKVTFFCRNVWSWNETVRSPLAVKKKKKKGRAKRRAGSSARSATLKGRAFLFTVRCASVAARAASTHHNHLEDGIYPRASPTRSHSDAKQTDAGGLFSRRGLTNGHLLGRLMEGQDGESGGDQGPGCFWRRTAATFTPPHTLLLFSPRVSLKRNSMQISPLEDKIPVSVGCLWSGVSN